MLVDMSTPSYKAHAQKLLATIPSWAKASLAYDGGEGMSLYLFDYDAKAHNMMECKEIKPGRWELRQKK